MTSASYFPARRVTLLRQERAPLPPSHEAAVAESWRQALERNPSLFNGPVASPAGAALEGGEYTVTWHASDFAHYLHSRQNRDTPLAGSTGTLFVFVVIPTTDGRLVTGRMSAHTSAPGVVQLPGGGVCIGQGQAEITEGDLTATALQEVSEELGIDLDPERLRISGIIERRSPRDIGVVFTAAARDWDEVRAAFAELRRREEAAGARPEFDELFAIGSMADVAAARGGIDYLPAVVGALLDSGGGRV